jgi:hypothetical protein
MIHLEHMTFQEHIKEHSSSIRNDELQKPNLYVMLECNVINTSQVRMYS